MATKSTESIDQVLSKIIDDWYERVSRYYVTKDDQEKSALAESTIELKRFHDAKGHRIKSFPSFMMPRATESSSTRATSISLMA